MTEGILFPLLCVSLVSLLSDVVDRSASQAVEWLQKQFRWSYDQSVFFLRLLATRHIIHHCSNKPSKVRLCFISDIKFLDNGDYWRFQCHEEGPLNCKHVWTLPIEESPCLLVEVMLKYVECSKIAHILQEIVAAHSTYSSSQIRGYY